MNLDDDDVSKTFENCQKIMDTLNAVVNDGSPYKKQLLLLTKIYPKHTIMPKDMITIVSGLLYKNLIQGFDRFSYIEKDYTFRCQINPRSVLKCFTKFSGKDPVVTSIEFLICSILTELENLVYEYPDYLRFKPSLFMNPVARLKPRKSRF